MSREKDAWALTQDVYDIRSFNKTIHNVNGKTYYVLDRIDNGVNALTLGTKQDYDNMKSGHPEKIKNATVVFRGSEPLSIPSRMGDYGGGKEGLDKIGGEILYDWLGTDYKYLINKRPFESDKSNAFKLSSDYVGKYLQGKFENCKFDMAGHSLAGSEVKFVLTNYPQLINKAYSFEGPNIYPCLSPEMQKVVRSGIFNDKLYDYMNLTDGLARLNRDEPSFGTQRIIFDPKATFGMKHADLAAYIKKNPLLSRLDSAFSQYGGLTMFDTYLKQLNPSLSYLMLSTFADHDLGRYQFDSKGNIRLLDGDFLSSKDLEQMRAYLAYSGMGEYSAPMLLIRGEILLNAASRCESRCEQIIKQLENLMRDVPEAANEAASEAKSYFNRLVGVGEFSELNTGHVEAFHSELEIEPGRFYKQQDVKIAEDTISWMRKQTMAFVEDIRMLANQFLKLDEELARKMDLR
ncbi:alpha/beta hydrolase family protein [Listeria kieliensis]